MPPEFKAYLIIGAIIAIHAWIGYSAITSCRRNIREWAEDKGYQILKMNLRMFRKGPYMFRSTEMQVVYNVLVEENGTEREGFIRQGGFIVGLGLGNKRKFQIRWVEPDTSKTTQIEDYL